MTYTNISFILGLKLQNNFKNEIKIPPIVFIMLINVYFIIYLFIILFLLEIQNVFVPNYFNHNNQNKNFHYYIPIL